MKIVGEVKIIKKPADYYKIKNKVIIIAHNTHPDIVIAINNILAIVTEVDNKLCHAAIIAREYQKPILMGIKDISKKLKDGEKVEVDTSAKTICKI